jgi:hypothetical protein
MDYVLESSRSRSNASKPTTAPSSKAASTGTYSIAGSATSTSSPRPHGSTARSSVPTASTPKSSTECSTASSSTTPQVFNQKLQEWEDFYNFHRPHGGPDGQTPYERLRQSPPPPPRKPRPSAAQSCRRTDTDITYTAHTQISRDQAVGMMSWNVLVRHRSLAMPRDRRARANM